MFKDKKIMVVGMARSGIASAKYLLNQGAYVIINDSKKDEELSEIKSQFESYERASYILGRNPINEDIDNIDMLIISPGVSPELDYVVYAKKNNLPVISEIELAYIASRDKDVDFLGITGTNGKTTTTSIIGEIVKASGKETYVVGNIGNPAIKAISECSNGACMVTELSSFQLESVDEFLPRVSTILNLTPDHLNRHHTMEEYAKAKMNIFKNQEKSEVCVLNYDDEITRNMVYKLKCKPVLFSRLYSESEINEKINKNLEKDIIIVDGKGDIIYIGSVKREKILNKSELSLPGGHNLENSMAAIGVCYNYGIDKDVISCVLKTFKAVEHRLEYVDTINGVDYVNDSKGTNPDSTIKAVTSYEKPIILIAGGYDKGSDFNELFEIASKNVRTVICLGQTRELVGNTAKSKGIEEIIYVDSLKEAVDKSYEISMSGDVVLLSPASASWGMYNNYEERGNDFKNCVAELKNR